MKHYLGWKQCQSVKELIDWGVIIERGQEPKINEATLYLSLSVILFIAVVIFV